MDKLSKNERKDMLRQQRQKSQDEYEKQERSKKVLLWIGIGVVLMAGIGVLYWAVSQEDISSNEKLQVSPSTTDKSYGNIDSEIELVEYGDFQCPACKSVYPLIKEVKEEYKNDVHFAYRHYPLPRIHPNAEVAAYASEASANQGKFWEMHDLLFENQSDWNELSEEEARNKMIDYARELELDIEQFEVDIDSSEVKDVVKKDQKSGDKAKVAGTPSFFLNGKVVDNISDIRDHLDEALNLNSALEDQIIEIQTGPAGEVQEVNEIDENVIDGEDATGNEEENTEESIE